MNREGERIQKVIARAGLASRREAEAWVRAGRVAVDGVVVGPGFAVGPRSRITVDGKPARLSSRKNVRIIAYHKPVGEICSRGDPAGRASVFDNLPALKGGGGRWIGVGRLDVNTSGLLLFTTDGMLAHRLSHPSTGLEREYLCRVLGLVERDFIRRLCRGVQLDGRDARFDSVAHQGGSGANRWYRVVIREGRYREVRRMWASGGLSVNRLVRVRYGPVRLPRDLKPGRYRDLPARQARELREIAASP